MRMLCSYYAKISKLSSSRFSLDICFQVLFNPNQVNISKQGELNFMQSFKKVGSLIFTPLCRCSYRKMIYFSYKNIASFVSCAK